MLTIKDVLPVLIFAGSFEEAKAWANCHPDKRLRYIYVKDPIYIEGMHCEHNRLYIVELPGFAKRLHALKLWEPIRRLSPYICLDQQGKHLVHYPSHIGNYAL